ncbi:NAD-dependent epimerase/dehydratase family protein [Saccharomonospora sp. NPDC006951]
MRVLVTGAGGFLGRTVTAKLVQDAHEVTALVRPGGSDVSAERARIVEADITDASQLHDALQGANFDAVVHLAALTRMRESDGAPGQYEEVNASGTSAMLTAINNELVPNVVYASTIAVYGPESPEPKEDSPTDPRNPYAESKLRGEKLLRAAAEQGQCRVTTLRCGNIAGGFRDVYDVNGNHIIPRVLESARSGEPVPVNGAGDAVRDYVHVEDVADAINLVLTKVGAKSSTYNVGSGQGVSVNDILTTAEAVTGIDVAVDRKPAVNETKYIVPDSSRIHDELQWTPARSSLARIIRDAWSALEIASV